MENIFFTNWESLARVAIMTFCAYFSMVFLLRISGKRTLSKMNAFDFIITVVMGSSLAAVALNKNITLLEGVVCFAMLIFMQYIVTWLSVRLKFVKKLVTSQPTFLLYNGELCHDVLKEERISIEDLHLALRREGVNSLSDVDAIILETTGTFNIMKKINKHKVETLESVELKL